MRLWAHVLFLVTCAHTQQLEFLNQKVDGRAARDSQGNWIFAEHLPAGLRLRKLSPDLTQTVFDIVTGGSGTAGISALQIDPDGNSYLTGVTTSTDFPTTPNALWPSAAGSNGLSYFLKLDPSGKIVTSTYLQVTNGSLLAGDMAAASNGDWIVAAQAAGPDPVRAGGVEIAGPGTLLLLRLSHDGTVLRGGRWIDIGAQPAVTAIRTDPSGNLFVAGSTGSDDFPATPGAYGQKRISGTCYGFGFFAPPFPCTAGYLMKFDGSDLHTLAATYLGGTRLVTLASLAVDRQGYPFVTGNVARFSPPNGDFPVTPGAFQTTFTGTGNLPVVTRLTPDLSALAYSTYLGGSNFETSTAIAVDDSGRAIVSGVTTSTDFPATGAFATQCGPRDPNFQGYGFVTRLSADGTAVDSSAILDATSAIQFLESGEPVTIAASNVVRVHLAPAAGPAAICTVNGASFRREGFLASGQLITVIGGPFPPETRLLFDGVAASMLYAGPTQLNAVVPRRVTGTTTLMEIDAAGARSNARQFDVRPANPSVKIWIAPDGSVDNRGNLLADVALSDGTPNTEENPAHQGEVVTVFATGIDITQPIAMRLNYTDAPVLRVSERPGTFGSVVGLDVRIPGPAGGMYVITIQNGPFATGLNPGFIWTQ